MIGALSWLVIAGWLVLFAYGVRTGLIWAHTPERGSPRTEFAGIWLLYTAALLVFAGFAPSANVIFAKIGTDGRVLGAMFAVIGLPIFWWGRAEAR